MKLPNNLKSWALPTMAMSLAFPAVSYAAQPSDTEWNAGGDGNWADSTWTGVIPTTGSLAGILTGDTVTVAAPAASDLEQLVIAGSSTLLVNSSIGIVGTDKIDNDPDPDTPATGLFVSAGTLSINSGGSLSVNTGGEFKVAESNTANLNLSAGAAITTDRLVILGLEGGALGTLTQTDGTLTHTGTEFRIGNFDGVGVYDISGGTASINTLKVGYAGLGNGSFNVSGASTNVTLNGTTSIGWDSRSSGSISVSDGTVNLNRIRIGVAGGVPTSGTRTAAFTQSGGTVDFSDRIDIGSSTPSAMLNSYSISGGSLTVTNTISVGAGAEANGTFNVSGTGDAEARVIIVAPEANSTGNVVVTGGGLTVVDEITVGPNPSPTASASVTVSDDGFLETDNLRLRNGSVTQSGEFSEVFIPAGGGGFFVGLDTTGDATYSMEDGTLTSETRLRIGVGATGTNLFDQTGGEVIINNRLDVVENGGASSTYQISGGTLSTTGDAFIGAFGSGTGLFDVSGSADVMIGGNMAIGRNSTVGLVNLTSGVVTANEIILGENAAGGSMLDVSGDASLSGTSLKLQNGTLNQSDIDSLVDITGELRMGADGSVDATYNMQGGMLVTGSRMHFSFGATPRNVTFNQTGGDVEIGARIDIGEVAGPTNSYDISGGSLSLTGGDSRILVGAFGDGTGSLNVSGTAEVDAGSIVLGESPTAVGTVNLDGGVLITDLIKTGGAAAGTQTLNLNGGTIRAASNVTDLISGNLPSNLLAGGVTFDVPDASWSVITNSVMTGVGGLTKIGPGKLTVTGVQAYTGDTRVEEGVLCIEEPFLDSGSNVYLYTGTELDLVFDASMTIGTLFIDDVAQAPGTFNSSNTPLITGLGELESTTGGTSADPEIVSITRVGSTVTIVMTGEPNTTYVCQSSLDLSGFAPIATTPSTVTTDGNGDAIFTVDATEDRKFYVVEEAP
ncbi:beta strand repeat-containing protein [Haloferula rosea]|uniref:Uncharacterized protein n=1 Tax=Haloferula rosea TaxID=490093 RepID=A0A934RC32_9BACT|nr:autotransporter-associated beta strand repeat-containing protein [Haloferula rosea]MBK1825876.1 hypothetical protein [Haloferula rosea]